MYPRFALPKLTTSEELFFYVEFYCWLDCSILVTRISSLHKFNNKSMTSSKSQKIGLIGTILSISLITQEIQELANMFALQLLSCLSYLLAFTLHDYYLEIRPTHNIFRGREPLFLLVFQSSGKSISFNKNLFSIDTCR